MAVGKPKKLLTFALVVSAVLTPFVFFSTPLRPWKTNARLATLPHDLFIYPLEQLWFGSVTFLSNSVDKYVGLIDASNENAQLKAELNGMKTRLLSYDEQVLENERLRSLLEFSKRTDRRLLPAEVVGHSTFGQFESLRISRGRHHGVNIGMPVVTAEGVVGKIIRTGEFFSDVQLLVDSDFHLDVLLQRTRIRGVISGADRTECNLNLHRRVEIRIGDTIITSGIVGGFPKGLPVGKVKRISYDAENVAQRITIEPWIDHNRLEEVTVIFSADPEVEKIAEAAGPEWLNQTIEAKNL